MNTYTKIALAPALAFAAALPLTSPALAGGGHEDIVVTSRADFQQWRADATRTLNQALKQNPAERRASSSASSGIVQVTFEMGADGKPANIELYSSTANWAAESSARYAVKRLGDLSDVPVSNPQGARFLANIIFADTIEERDDLARDLARSEAGRLVSSDEGFIVLGG